MTPGLSLYLDALRITAAFMVFLNHAGYGRLHGSWLGPWSRFGHDAVIIFFVLSGFVIAWVTTTRERGPLEYAIARLARLWSVVIPALILGGILDHYGSQLDPKLYDGWWYAGDRPVWRFLANTFFFAEVWTASIRAFSNGPMWSVQYELWYYAIFAFALFPPKRWQKALGVVVAVAVAGPAIVLLLPCWLAGVGVFRLVNRRPLPPLVGGLLFTASIGAFAWFHAYDVKLTLERWAVDTLQGPTQEAFGVGFVHLARYARSFLGDYLLTLIVAAHFLGAHALSPYLERGLTPFARLIRWAAGYTFVLYLLHYPLLHFYASLTKNSVVILLLVLQSVLLLGVVTEQAKPHYRRALQWGARLLGSLGQKRGQADLGVR